MNTINIQHLTTPYGDLIIGSFEDQLCLCDWRYRKMRDAIDKRILSGLDAQFREKDSSIIQQTTLQLNEYFNGDRKKFEIPFKLIGSDFQESVWNELIKIPFGETETYLGLSRKLGNEKAIRAVATANGANAISIIIPCHRIIGSNGDLVGYAGGLPAKKKLLQLETNNKYPEQLDLFI